MGQSFQVCIDHHHHEADVDDRPPLFLTRTTPSCSYVSPYSHRDIGTYIYIAIRLIFNLYIYERIDRRYVELLSYLLSRPYLFQCFS